MSSGSSHLKLARQRRCSFRQRTSIRKWLSNHAVPVKAAASAAAAAMQPPETTTTTTTTSSTFNQSRRLTITSLTLVTIVAAAQTATCHQQPQQQPQSQPQPQPQQQHQHHHRHHQGLYQQHLYLQQAAAADEQQLLAHQYHQLAGGQTNEQQQSALAMALTAALTLSPLSTSNQTQPLIDDPATTNSEINQASGGSQVSSGGGNGAIEDNMKFPLYMRIIATIACLLIFAVGVSGNLLVPLVVIKTKYLRNSTNLFLINLSVADLLVLIVCMPTVLIELHSRPETWLLGEPMCKLSNYVEMLAANGSIFTILAISFERYYAICKPLKAGYKCTRLRATIIICLVWLLASLLTSPILMMAKSSETIYIDGSLVYNCILETNTYWTKMYVFVSMIAFFCLPLLVLMLVYWLIGRRLTRESIAISTTTSLSASETGDTAAMSQHAKSSGGDSATFGRIGQSRLRKAISLKTTLSNFLNSIHIIQHKNQLHRQHQQHDGIEFNNNNNNNNNNRKNNRSLSSTINNRIAFNQLSNVASKKLISGNKSLSLDQRLLHCKSDAREVATGQQVQGGNHLELTKNLSPFEDHVTDRLDLEPKQTKKLKKSLANQIVYQLFHLKSTRDDSTLALKTHTFSSKNLSNHTNGFTLDSSNKLLDPNDNVCYLTNEIDYEEQQQTKTTSQSPFLSSKNLVKNRGSNDAANSSSTYLDMKYEVYNSSQREKRSKTPKLTWLRNLTASSLSTSANTDSTNLPSESSVALSLSHNNNEQLITNNSVRSILHSDRSISPTSNSHQIRKKFAHFNVNSTMSDPLETTCQTTSSLTNDGSYSSSASPSSSKSPTPDSLFSGRQNDNEQQQHTINHKNSSTYTTTTTSAESPVVGQHRLEQPTPHHVDSSPLAADSTSEYDIDYQGSNNRARDAFSNNNRCDVNVRLNRTHPYPIAEGIIVDNDSRLPAKQSNSYDCSKDASEKNTAARHLNGGISRFGRFSTRQNLVCGQYKPPAKTQLTELLVVQDLSKKQQMDSRRQVVIMLAFVVTCFFLLFFPYRLFTIWLILSTDDQVQSLGMETYYNLTYFCRILIYLHSAINPIAYNLISAKFRKAFMSILLCRGSASRRHFITEHRIIQSSNKQKGVQKGRQSTTYNAQHHP